MNALREAMVRRIRAAGPMPVAAYMQLALYHPQHGYYSAGATRTGRGGDFVTSPELDRSFPALWARGLHEIWQACGRPAPFDFVEVGPGEGSFAQGLLEAAAGEFAEALRVHLVERTSAVEARQRDRLAAFEGRVEWHPSVVEVPAVDVGVVFANELLDNLPVHLVERVDGDLREVCVDVRDDSLIEVLLPLSSPEIEGWMERNGVVLDEGHRAEVQLAAESFVKRAAGIVGRGAIVLVDYGATSDELLARPRGTLVCYSGSGADDAYLESPGSKDITAHVNWTSIRNATEAAGLDAYGPAPQRDVLRRLGLEELDARLAEAQGAAVDAGRGPDAVRAMSRRQALAVMAEPGGLGDLGVVVACRGIPRPSFL